MAASNAIVSLPYVPDQQSTADELVEPMFVEDTQHLSTLGLTFVSKVNLVLCVKDGERLAGLPVHSDVLSGISPVLSQILDDLQQRSDVLQQQEHSPPRLPLVDDKCCGVRAVLGHVYQSFPHTDGSKVSLESTISLDQLPEHAEFILFCHKYGMTTLLMALEADWKGRLEVLLDNSQVDLEKILPFAEAAENCECFELLNLCEAHGASDRGSIQLWLLTSKLSKASLCRIHQGVVYRHERRVQAMTEALNTSVEEAQAICKNEYHAGMLCPRCGYLMDFSKKKNVVHKDRNSHCRWPRRHTLQPCDVKLHAVAAHLAGLT